MYSADSSIIGQPAGRPAQAAAFICSRPHGEYTEWDIRAVIVPAYFRLAAAVGVDPILALAQMIHETGNLTSFWSQRPQRNPAGIGVTGRAQPHQPADCTGWCFNDQRQQWEMGVSFASWEHDAIPAQLGRLLAYALRPGEGSAAQEALIARALRYRPFPDAFRGTARTIKALGRAHNPLGARGAGWASPGTRYGEALASIANRIVALPVV